MTKTISSKPKVAAQKISDLLSPLSPMPYIQLKTLLKLLECGFRFEQAQKIVLNVLELKYDLTNPVRPLKREKSKRLAQTLRVVPHPRGWTILSVKEVKPYLFYQTREEAVERARSDAAAYECPMCIHGDSGELEEQVPAPRNY